MARRQDDGIDVEVLPLGEDDALAPASLGHDVDRLGAMPDDLHLRGRRSDERRVEPLQVLAHEPAREVVVRGDLAPERADLAGVADPPVAGRRDPFVQAGGVLGRWSFVLPGIERHLTARGVEDQVVRLVHRVDARTGRVRLDDVDPHRTPLRARAGDHALEEAQAPRAQADDCDVHQPSPLLHDCRNRPSLITTRTVLLDGLPPEPGRPLASNPSQTPPPRVHQPPLVGDPAEIRLIGRNATTVSSPRGPFLARVAVHGAGGRSPARRPLAGAEAAAPDPRATARGRAVPSVTMAVMPPEKLHWAHLYHEVVTSGPVHRLLRLRRRLPLRRARLRRHQRPLQAVPRRRRRAAPTTAPTG